jgi:metal-responsive CopG/Arc/MetJ family transcriptional regulator
MDKNQSVTVRIPSLILEAADIAVANKLYNNRNEAIVDCIRTGVRHVFFSPDELKNATPRKR